jgi:hypothetical protein
MPTGALAYHFIARHGYAIERLKRDMATEETREDLVGFLAYDAACFVYSFLLASGNAVSPTDRTVRDDLKAAISWVLAKHASTATRSSSARRSMRMLRCPSRNHDESHIMP